MGTTPPTLDYATPPRHARVRALARKWLKRLSLALLLLACLWAAPLAWLYWGWRQEQPAREMVARLGGIIYNTEPAGPVWLEPFIPARLGWIRNRVRDIAIRWDRPVTGDDLSTLRPLRRLKAFHLSGTRVTDAGLAQLKGLAGLQLLNLSSTQVTDAGLVHLKGLTGLQTLMLVDTQLTDTSVAELQKALPQCEIRWSKRPPPAPPASAP